MTLFEKISLSTKEGKIEWRKHALSRMLERNISRKDVKQAILSGEVLEDYPDDQPFYSILIAYVPENDRALHIVVSYGDDRCYIITAYEPSEKVFGKSLKKRGESSEK